MGRSRVTLAARLEVGSFGFMAPETKKLLDMERHEHYLFGDNI